MTDWDWVGSEVDSGSEVDGKLELRDRKLADSDSGVGVVRLKT